MALKFVLSLREEQKTEDFWKEGASETRLIETYKTLQEAGERCVKRKFII
jgi:hypothetical protein